MAESLWQTKELTDWVTRFQAGDQDALNDLLRHSQGRLERLARRMLSDHPAVQRWAQTDDVLQNALMRLARALATLRPDSVRAFFGLAAQQVRRELIDLARHYHGPRGEGANHVSASRPPENGDETHNPDVLAEWSEVHLAIEDLPEEERTVVDMLFYQGLSQAEAAAVLEVTVRTVQRRWHAALLKLHGRLKRDS